MRPQDAPNASKLLHNDPKTSPSTLHKQQKHVRTSENKCTTSNNAITNTRHIANHISATLRKQKSVLRSHST